MSVFEFNRGGGETSAPRILLGGERTGSRVRVWVDGTALWLTHSQTRILAKLIAARAGKGTGFLRDEELYPKAVWLLRRALDRASAGKGYDFIEAGSAQQYRLKFHPHGLVAVEESIRELAEIGVLSPELLADVCAICPAGDPWVIRGNFDSRAREIAK